jgi:hypothetical protein
MTGRRRAASRARRGVRLAGAMGAAALVAASVACEQDESDRGAVLLVGDSIFSMATEELTWVLRSDGWQVTIDARPGAGIRNGGFDEVDWPSRLRDLVAVVQPRVVVVELGTNGCGRCDSIPQAIDHDMTQLRGVDQVLWLGVATFGPRAEQGTVVNAELGGATERWDNLEVLPYDDWFAGHPELIPPDDVHPTPAGEQALAEHVGDALRERGSGSGGGNRALGALALVLVAVVLLRGGRKTS